MSTLTRIRQQNQHLNFLPLRNISEAFRDNIPVVIPVLPDVALWPAGWETSARVRPVIAERAADVQHAVTLPSSRSSDAEEEPPPTPKLPVSHEPLML